MSTMRTVESLCSSVHSGGTPSRKERANFEDGEIPWIKTMDLRDGPVVRTDEFITAQGLESSAAKWVPAGSTLIAMYGATVGRLGYLTYDATSNQAACALVPNPYVCDSRWLYYVMLWSRGRLAGLASGAAQQNLNVSMVKSHEVPDFALSDQEGIGEVLGAFDDKIAANGAVVSSAETLRQTAWVRATRGAELAPLSSFAQFVNGGAYTKGATGTGRVVIRIAELNSGIGASTVYNDLKVPGRQVAHAGDLLMSWSGSLTAVRWYRDDAIINQHIFKVIPRDGYPLWAVASAVETKLAEFQEIAAGKATTMGHIKRADLDSPVAWLEISDRLNDAGTALWERALAAEQENLRLAATRDKLLPLLMSGQITVKDAEKTVEEVV